MGKREKADFRSKVVIGCMKVMACLPLGAVRWLGSALAQLWVYTKSDLYLTARRNFDLCFSSESDSEHHERALKALKQTAKTMTEASHAWVRPLEENRRRLGEIHGEAHLKAAIEAEEGILFIVPHLGNWEWLNVYLPNLCPIDVLYKSIKNAPGLDAFVASQRERCGVRVWPGDSMGLRSYMRTFLKGGNILILPDQEPAEKSGIYAPFFGHLALTPRIVSDLLKKRPGAHALVVYALRTPKGFDIHIERPLDALYDNDPLVSATALNKSIERAVLKAPDQYQWGYKRFRKQPEGRSNPYKKLKWRFKDRKTL